MSFINTLDVPGPNMVGPSGSRTAGAYSVDLMARRLLDEPAREMEFILYGSFTETYKDHDMDRALLGRIMGFFTDDVRISNAYDLAGKRNITWTFTRDEIETELCPNTVDIHMTGVSEKTVPLRGEPIGGGKVRVVRINGTEVDFSGEYNTLIVIHRDCISMVTHITSCLSKGKVNIVFIELSREARGDWVYSIVGFDDSLPEATWQRVKENQDVEDVTLVQIREVE